jgi:membrane-bound inhibitor of C-type lysozyme
MYRFLSCISLLLVTTACAGVGSPAPSIALCAAGWAQGIESQLQTGDGRGHGPDIGSDEWQSVVEFRLGIRDLPGLPERGSAAWCAYVEALADDRMPVIFACDDDAATKLAVHFLPTEPRTLIARRGDRLALMAQQRSASGAKYAGDDAALWEHHGEATVTWGADAPEMRCRVTR